MNSCKDGSQCAVAKALLAILVEAAPDTEPPFSGYSYLPAHLVEQARAALADVGITALGQAPDLLEAVQRIVREYRAFDLTIGAIEDAEAAILKATEGRA